MNPHQPRPSSARPGTGLRRLAAALLPAATTAGAVGWDPGGLVGFFRIPREERERKPNAPEEFRVRGGD